MCTKRYSLAIQFLALLLLLSVRTFANSNTDASFVLGNPSGQLSNAKGPYGTVNLHLNTNGTITVTLSMSSGFGIGGKTAFGFNGPLNIKMSAFSSGFSCCKLGSGYGYQYLIAGPTVGPRKSPPTVLKFVVTLKGKKARFTSVSQLGTVFMANVIPKNRTWAGFADTRTVVAKAVSDGEPSSLALLSLALAGTSVFMFVHKRLAG